VALVALVPQNVTIEAYQGDDWAFQLIFTDSAGNPIDFTGATLLAQVRATPTSPDPAAATFTISIAANVVSYGLATTVTAALPQAAVWDCQVTDTTGKVTTIAGGRVTVRAQVTR